MAYKFIVLEGIDGCGKATQAKEIERMLKRLRQPVFLHKYPTENAKKVHEHLNGKKLGQDELFEAFAKDLQEEQGILREHLQKGWVLADRYCISTAAYQGVGGNLEKRISQLEKMDWIKPDIVIWLDLPAEEAIRRKAGQKKLDLHEGDRAFLEEVGKNYNGLYRQGFICKKWERIDANLPVQKIAEKIRKAIEK